MDLDLGSCLGCVSGQWRPQGVTLWNSVDPNITGPPLSWVPSCRRCWRWGRREPVSADHCPPGLRLSQGPESPASSSLVPFRGAVRCFLLDVSEVPAAGVGGLWDFPDHCPGTAAGGISGSGPCTPPLAMSFLRPHLGSFQPVTLNWEPCWGVQGTFSPQDHQTTRRGAPIPQQEVD